MPTKFPKPEENKVVIMTKINGVVYSKELVLPSHTSFDLEIKKDVVKKTVVYLAESMVRTMNEAYAKA